MSFVPLIRLIVKEGSESSYLVRLGVYSGCSSSLIGNLCPATFIVPFSADEWDASGMRKFMTSLSDDPLDEEEEEDNSDFMPCVLR